MNEMSLAALGRIPQPPPEMSLSRLAERLQPNGTGNRVYDAISSGSQWLVDKATPFVPPELRGKLRGLGELLNMANPATALQGYTHAARQGNYGEAALNAAGLIPGEALAAGAAKLAALPAAAAAKGALGSLAPLARTSALRETSGMANADEVRAALRKAIEADDGYFYGVRVTPEPLKVGERAPPSKQFYADFIDEAHPTFGREAFPDHGADLVGPSVVGIRSAEDIERALQAAGFAPITRSGMDYSGQGRHVSLLRSNKREMGYDDGEWLLPNAETVLTWTRD